MFPSFPELPRRAGGILLHPTSLPGPYGIGDLGPHTYTWLQWVHSSGSSLWQILPLGPTGYADSPYQSFSAFAGNRLLISPELLGEQGLLKAEELVGSPAFPYNQVKYGEVIPWKDRLFDQLSAKFRLRSSVEGVDAFEAFCEDQAYWLEDYALFMAIKHRHGGRPWSTWESTLRDRDPDALDLARDDLTDEIFAQKLSQFFFHEQWFRLKQSARALGICILGDMPLFVAHDSVDVWVHRTYFQLDSNGNPTVVAGVPPDYFSVTGQRWGNPLYDWDALAKDGYDWWIRRVKKTLEMVDVVRLDHFRGLQAYWEIPGSASSAVEGRWVPGPDHALLQALKQALGGLPLIAEDLGVITPEVIALRKDHGLPGMKVMQFGFEAGPEDEFLPHRFEEASVAYTGTHDNDTTEGWYEAAEPEVQAFTRNYLSSSGEHIAWDMIEALWASPAAWTIAPLQDLLGLGSEARMNFPSQTLGNWRWRVSVGQLNQELADRLYRLNIEHSRDQTTKLALSRERKG